MLDGDEKQKIVSIVEAVQVSGLAKPALLFAEEATKIGSDVTILNFVRGAEQSPFMLQARSAGVKVEPIYESRAFDVDIVYSLRRYITEIKPSVIFTHAVKSHFLARLLRLNKTARWIAFHHGYTTTDRTTLVYNQLNRWSLREAHRVVTVCKSFVPELVAGGVPESKITVQHNCARPYTHPGHRAVDALKRRLGISREKVLLSVGRLSEEKGHIDLIEAFSQLGPEVHLIVAGDGPEWPRLERRARELGIIASVHFMGHVADVSALYAAADVFVLPSYSEGSPNVILEALMAGLPIVATQVGGIPEMLPTGSLVPAHNVRELASAINRALGANRLAVNEAIEKWSPEAYYRGVMAATA